MKFVKIRFCNFHPSMRRLTAIIICFLAALSLSAQGVLDATTNEIQKDSAKVFLNFTINPGSNNSNSVLAWTTRSVQPEDYFIVERTSDGVHFETVSAIGATAADSSYQLTDDPAVNHTLAYRIKYLSKEGKLSFSRIIAVSSTVPADFKFYPNPVDKLLIIRTAHPLSIQVMDVYGTVWYTGNLDAGMQIVNVATLPKGNFILKAVDRETNAVSSDQLLKN